MSEFIDDIHHRLRFKMDNTNSLSRRSKEEKYGMDIHFFNEGQLLELENDNVVEVEDAEDVELARINMAIWEKKN